MAAAVWCKEHGPTKSTAHQLQTPVEGTDLTSLQLFVQNYKQADLTLTGTVRKAMLVNQSSKVLNPIPVTAVPNRRTSTTNASGNRVSVSHIKTEDTSREANAARHPDQNFICVTCDVDVSPRWRLYTPAIGMSPAVANGDIHPVDSPMANGFPTDDPAEITASQVAIATAALHENMRPVLITTPTAETQRQCHKCYVRNIKIKEPSPPPPSKSPSLEPTPPPVETSTDVPMPDANMTPSVPQYGWAPPPFASNGPYTNVPAQSPSVHGPPSNHVNGITSPHINNGGTQQFPSQAQIRQQALSHSPRQNGHTNHGSNGYPPPPPPHETASSSVHMQNGSSYGSYASTQPLPHHLTNGGPPPHAPERPFQQPMHADFHYSPTYGPHSSHMSSNGNYARDTEMESRHARNDSAQRRMSGLSGIHGSPRLHDHDAFQHQSPPETSRYSPPIPVDPALFTTQPNPVPRPGPQRQNNGNGNDNGNGNGNPSQDRWVDGGASASPSLRNLLS